MIVQEVSGRNKRAYSHSMTDYYQMQFSQPYFLRHTNCYLVVMRKVQFNFTGLVVGALLL